MRAHRQTGVGPQTEVCCLRLSKLVAFWMNEGTYDEK